MSWQKKFDPEISLVEGLVSVYDELQKRYGPDNKEKEVTDTQEIVGIVNLAKGATHIEALHMENVNLKERNTELAKQRDRLSDELNALKISYQRISDDNAKYGLQSEETVNKVREIVEREKLAQEALYQERVTATNYKNRVGSYLKEYFEQAEFGETERDIFIELDLEDYLPTSEFSVEVRYEGTAWISVEATSAEEARRKVDEHTSGSDVMEAIDSWDILWETTGEVNDY